MNTKTTFEGIEASDRKWHLVDASNLPLGRLASEIAQILRGKHKPEYAPHLDVGDHIVVINAEKIQLTANKAEQKTYYSHSGYPGGIKEESFNSLKKRKPEKIIERAELEADLPATYYTLDEIASKMNSAPLKLNTAIEKLKSSGFNASMTSLNPSGFRTNCQIDKIIEIFQD